MEQKTFKQKVKQFCQSEYMPFAVFGIAIFLMLIPIHLIDGDDSFFQNALSKQSLFSWLWMRYQTISGRMSAELALGLMHFNMPIWRVLNAVVSVVLMVCVSKYATATITDKQTRKYINIILCCLFFTMYPYVITSSVMWYTGSFFYLWPCAALMCALLPFYYALIGKKTVYKVTYVLYFIATAFTCYLQQFLAVFLIFGLLEFLYLRIAKAEISKKLVGQYVFGLINVIIYFLAPGPKGRMAIEMHWYPNFPMLTTIDKLFQGVNWTNMHYTTASNLLFLAFTLLIFAVYYCRYKRENKILVFFSALPPLFCLGRILPFNAVLSRVANFQHGMTANFQQDETSREITIDVEKAFDRIFYNTMAASPGNINTGWHSLAPSIFTFCIILFVAVLLMNAFEKKSLSFFTTVLYLGALATGYILFVSPTIFASGSRVFFIGDILILLISGILLSEWVKLSHALEKRWMKYSMIALVVFSGIMVIVYASYFSSHILCL